MINKLDEEEEKSETGLCCSEIIHENLGSSEINRNVVLIHI